MSKKFNLWMADELFEKVKTEADKTYTSVASVICRRLAISYLKDESLEPEREKPLD